MTTNMTNNYGILFGENVDNCFITSNIIGTNGTANNTGIYIQGMINQNSDGNHVL